MQYLICYDISEQKIRTKVAKYLEHFACRIQYSIFLCDDKNVKIEKVRMDLLEMTKQSEKRTLLFVSMCHSCAEKLCLIGEALEKEEICIVA